MNHASGAVTPPDPELIQVCDDAGWLRRLELAPPWRLEVAPPLGGGWCRDGRVAL